MRFNSLNYSLEKLAKFALSHPKIIQNISRLVNYNDEPKIFTYVAHYSTNGKSVSDSSSGTSFNQKRALIKVLGEAFERYCLDTVDEKNLITASISELNDSYLDPLRIPTFSKNQLSKISFKQFVITRNTKFRWIKGYSYRENKITLIPAQLVFTNYKLLKYEPFIRFPVSTGGATHVSLESALYRGICESIERDSFMIYYLNKIPPRIVNINTIKDREFNSILNILNRYKLELRLLNMSTDLEIPVYVSLLFDKTGRGPAVSLGLKAGFDTIAGFIGSVEEALMTRSWIRDEFIYRKKEFKISEKIETLDQRAYYWLKPEMIKKLDFLLEGVQQRRIHKSNHKSEKDNLQGVLEFLKKANLDVYYVDITQRKIKEAGFIVLKVFIPELYPVYFDEKYPYFGIPRLYDVPVNLGIAKKKKKETEFNLIPHPFL